MRTKKALINSSVNIVAFIIAFIPNLIVRKVFLDTLGSDMLGLNSLYTNILGWLSIVELGVGTIIIYSLYKPFAEDDKKKISEYIRFYGKFYRKIGFIILTIGIIVSFFLKFFIEGEVDLKLATIGFILFLINSFISYLFSNKLCILNVAQEAYRVTIATTISKLAIMVIQLIMLKINPNFLLFILIQIGVNIIYFLSINIYINKRFPWLNEYKSEIEGKEKKELYKNIRAMFLHKIGSLVVNSTDNIVISKFLGLAILGRYANYQMVISAFHSIIDKGLGGITASVGNMLSTSNKRNIYYIHKKIFFLNFWIVSFFVISLYNTLNQFIGIWIGEKYLLDNLTYVVLLANFYFAAMRGSVEQFQNGSGTFYYDRYAPLCEALINIVASIILVKHMGIAGVFIGTLISNLTVIFWTKPYVVYKYVFHRSLIEYFFMYFKYLIIGMVPLIISSYITTPIKGNYNIKSFIINCIINIVVINGAYIFMLSNTEEFKYYKAIFKGIVNKFKGKKQIAV